MAAPSRAAVALTLLWLAGCASNVSHKQPPAPPPPPKSAAQEYVYIDSALIEQPLGDPYLGEGLWEAGDEQFVGLENLPLLEDNGIRVCRLGGSLPPKLLALMSSKRSCPQPRRSRSLPGETVTLAIGPRRSELAFTLHARGEEEVRLNDVECGFEVNATAIEGGKLQLRLVPQARHVEGRRRAGVETTAEGLMRLALEARAPTDDFPVAAIEVPLAPGEFAVLGPRMSRQGTLGPAWFLGNEESGPVQRVLVLRAAYVAPEKGAPGPALAGPLASQAGRATIRGSSR
jgi:hypothetical protein